MLLLAITGEFREKTETYCITGKANEESGNGAISVPCTASNRSESRMLTLPLLSLQRLVLINLKRRDSTKRISVQI
jgi:hypothetical protein